MSPTRPSRAHCRRASALGIAATALLACTGTAVLRAAGGRAATMTTEVVPVEEAVVTLAALGVGAGLLLLAWLSGLGSLAAASPSGPDRRRVPGGRWAGRAGALLLALTMSTPAAQAVSNGSSDPGVQGSSLAGLATAAPHRHLPAASGPGPDEKEPQRRFPLPGWRSVDPQDGAGDGDGDGGTLGQAPADGAGQTDCERVAVVVADGDTLWGIAASGLGPAATPRQIAQHWPRWYHQNRRTIGRDPDLIRPGQVLDPPPVGCPTTRRPGQEAS
ncbi:MAG TPA: LysM domain-containing protein [Ornithinimicrobium sp.]|uniref:LysM peptidoglycan-binding domain-containing protein n=1 Tax=Ornithinimicrobium sp. TaxID=1977084 RepID=UPI002B47E233|nr:LysM domain-containing protein [Ornithinimicrobium sp.]HKJ12592.1 LysM domain-containing protein [Ornithinimicrobium sp.]